MTKQVDIYKEVFGRGGGSKKGGGGTTAPNSLRSNARARMVEAISEGPIEGLVNAENSIFFSETPIENANGTKNFKNVIWEERKGLPDDTHLKGHTAVESLTAVDVTVTKDGGGVIRTITDPDVDAVRVNIRLDSLFFVGDDGNLLPWGVQYVIEVRPFGGSFSTYHNELILNKKTTSPFQLSHKIDLPLDGAPWDVRVRRINADETDDKRQNVFAWESYVTLKEGRFTYPNTALVGLEVDAKSLGQGIPPRSYHVRGRIIEVPDNYDPLTRVYTGVWGGTFKLAWTNNPAWIFRDLIVNDRYGIGEYVDTSLVNKWSLYTIAQYCDELVPSGLKDDLDADIMEPRFTFNGVLRQRREAYYALQMITRSFRGMGFWSLGQVFATSDMPTDPSQLVAPANVIDGKFTYSSTATKARHTVALVRWNDPNNHYKPATELVIHHEGLKRYGWREKRLDFEGCASRGLAHRYGKWVLDTEQEETETVTYKASFDHALVRPGDVVMIADPRKATYRRGGRIKAHNASTDVVTLDAPANLTVGPSYTIHLTNKDGEIFDFPITISGDDVDIDIGTTSEVFEPNSLFAITGTDVAPRRYRVLTLDEVDPNVFQITALFHDPTKYARVEQNISFDPPPYTVENPVAPATGLTGTEIAYIENEKTKSKVRLNWTPPDGVIVQEYVIRADTPFNADDYIGSTPNTTFDIENAEVGDYTFYVSTIDRIGRISEAVEFTLTVTGTASLQAGSVQNLVLSDDPLSTVFRGPDASIIWDNVFPTFTGDTTGAQSNPVYSHNIVKIYDETTDTLLRTQRVIKDEYVYTYQENLRDCLAAALTSATRSLRFEVEVHSQSGTVSAPAILNVTNNTPASLNPSVTVNGRTITISAPTITDNDLAGMKVWIETSSGINTGSATPKYDGTSTYVTWSGDNDTTYYIKAAYRDQFDDTYVDSPEVSITTEANEGQTPPSVPTGLSVSSVANGDGTSVITIDWTSNSESWVVGYELLIERSGFNDISIPVTINTHQVTSLSGVSYDFSVRAVALSGRRSAYASPVNHTAAADSTPPATPTGVSSTSGFGSIWLEWNDNTEADFHHYEIYETASSGATPNSGTVATFSTTAPALTRTTLDNGATRYYFVRAVDISGNKSGWTAEVTASAVDFDLGDLGGTITSTQIDDNAITTPKLAANSVTAGKLTTGELITLSAQIKDAIINNAKILDLSAAKLQAGTALASTITVSGTQLGTIDTRAADPAARVNSQATQIDPGKIVISGGTSLADWRGTDQTTIAGGKIETNTITADKIVIGDYANYADGSDFEIEALSPWTVEDGISGIETDQAHTGTRSFRIEFGASPDVRASLNRTVPAQENDEFYIEFWARRNSFWNGTTSEIRVLDQADVVIGSVSFDSSTIDTWEFFSGSVIVTAGTSSLKFQIYDNNDNGRLWLDNIGIKRQLDGALIVNGGVTTDKLRADVLSADNITTGELSASLLNIDDLLTIDAANAGFSMGKVSANDPDNDGIYMGRTLEEDGSTGFGLSMSKTNGGGLKQSLRATAAEGLQISNAQFFRELTVPSNFSTYDSNTNFDITGGTASIEIEMIGGGGGGGAGANGFPGVNRRGSDGNDTTVILKDGTTTIETWVASGGDGSDAGFIYATKGQRGQSSVYGNGGAGGLAFIQAAPAQLPTNGSDGVGRGSGGGGGGDNYPNTYYSGKRGYAGQFKEISYDISGLTDPKIEITIGSGGNGNNAGSKNGGDGADGRVRVREISSQPTPADVIPIQPTYTGTFSNPLTNVTFPDHGAGFWVVYATAGNDLDIGIIEIDDNGNTTRVNGFGSLSFVSAKTPVWSSGGSSGSDIGYLFYKMGT